MMECKICGKSKSNKRVKFNAERLKQHMQDAHQQDNYDGDPTFELTDMIADEDWPDGAYFALAWELGEY